MAEEAILQVSLRDYKKSIDDLRASLLSLEEGSEEYAATAEEIRQRQDKLNEVMSVGKKEVDGVAGSYNALSQEMSRLKKEWKTLEIGSEQWVAMGQQIDAINDKLKSADASVGVFSRNVGDYENAFVSAFEKSVDALGKVDGPLGGVMKTVKQLIPVIKNANSTAVKGLSGVKKAIVSTGVGALVVAVGLLVANWDKLMKVFRKGSKDTEKLIESNDTLNKSFDEQNRQLENEIIVMQADGASADEVNAKKQALIATQIAETRATIEETKAKIAQIGKHSLLGRILRGEQGEFKKLQETLENLTATETGLVQQEERINANTYADRVRNRTNAANKEIEEVRRILEEVEKASKTELQELDEKYKKEYALLKKHHKDTSKLTAQYNKDLAKLQREEATQRAQAIATAMSNLGQYFPRFSLANEYQQANVMLKEFKKAAGQDFPPKGMVDTVLAGESIGNQFDDAAKKAKEWGLIATDSSDEFAAAWIAAYKRVQAAENSLNIYDIEYFKDAERNWEKYINKIKEFSEDDALRNATDAEGHRTGFIASVLNKADKVKIELDYEIDTSQSTLNAVEKQFYDVKAKIEDKLQEEDGFITFPANASMKDVLDMLKDIDAGVADSPLREYYENLQMYYKMYVEEEQNLSGLQKARLSREKELEFIRKEGYALQQENQSISPFKNTSNIDELFEARYSAATAYYEYIKTLQYDSADEQLNAEGEALRAITELEQEYFAQRLRNRLDFLNSVADIMGSIADIMDQSIENEKQNLIEQGKTEEEANELLKGRFKYVQAFQISQAVINTIAGALAAFTRSQELGQPWGMAIGIAQAAAVTAAGVAQIQKIANTKLGSGAGNVSSISANSTPKLIDYEPQKTQNITGASDEEKLQKVMESTNIWVSVKDINSVQSGVKARVSESSF